MTPEEQWLADLAAEKDEYTRETLNDYAAEAAALGAATAALWVVLRRRIEDDKPITRAWLLRQPQYRAVLAGVGRVITRGSIATEKRVPAALTRASAHADKALRALAALTAAPKRPVLVAGRQPAALPAAKVLDALTPVKRAAAIEARKTVAIAALERHRAPLALEAAKDRMTKQLVTLGLGNKPMTRAEMEFIVSREANNAARRSLTVLNTETANVGRQLVEDVIGDDGDWLWVTREDERVCDVCGPNHGRLFPASVIFDAFHVNCRCLAVPAK